MAINKEIVITGMGTISPIGITSDEYWTSIIEGRSGIGPLTKFAIDDELRPLCGEAPDFNAKKRVRSCPPTKKSIKVMSQDIQLGFVAALDACANAGIGADAFVVDPERFGVLYGADLIGLDIDDLIPAYLKCMEDGKVQPELWGSNALENIFPLWMLKYLPNMPACHIGIGQDARGPNDSLTLDRVSGLSAISEACRIIERGQADVMIAGATSSRTDASIWARQQSMDISPRKDDPASVMRPFDAGHDGYVAGEGAAAFVLESREHAEARGATPLAKIAGFAHRFHWNGHGQGPDSELMAKTISAAIEDASLTPEDIGHVNAAGISTVADDRAEASAIRKVLGDVPVTAPTSYFGQLFAATGAVEMVASILGLQHGLVPPTLNYASPDAECPVNVVSGEAISGTAPTALLMNHCRFGRTAAMVIAKA